MMKFPFFLFMLLFVACSATKPQSLLNDVKELSSDKYQGRKTSTEGNRKAADYIVRRFESIGLNRYHNSFRYPFSFKSRGKDIGGTNLIAYIPGKKKDIIVISAHYDHVGVVNGKIYNGADDNASGVAGMLEIANYFKHNQPEHTLLFAAFDGEEMGLQGAKAFLNQAPVDISLIRLNINLDMVSHNDKGELYVAGTYYYPDLKDYLFITNPKIKLLAGHDRPDLSAKDNWTDQGDHGAFYALKIPFLYFGVEDHKDYHQPTDDYENINKEFFKDAVSVVLEVVRNYDQGRTLQKTLRSKKIMTK